MSDYTPSPAEVQAQWAWTPGHLDNPEAHAVREEKMRMFDRMLAQVRAEAARESARYIEMIQRPGLVNRATILADLESVAWRMENGMTARGNLRADRIEREIGLK